jgi:hypothetical protein
LRFNFSLFVFCSISYFSIGVNSGVSYTSSSRFNKLNLREIATSVAKEVLPVRSIFENGNISIYEYTIILVFSHSICTFFSTRKRRHEQR